MLKIALIVWSLDMPLVDVEWVFLQEELGQLSDNLCHMVSHNLAVTLDLSY